MFDYQDPLSKSTLLHRQVADIDSQHNLTWLFPAERCNRPGVGSTTKPFSEISDQGRIKAGP